jgi:hypothetical protein
MPEIDPADSAPKPDATPAGTQYEVPIEYTTGVAQEVSLWKWPPRLLVRVGSLVQEAALAGKEWVEIFRARMGDALLKTMTITAAGERLAQLSGLAVGYCINLLRTTGIWEKKNRGRPNPPGHRFK